MRGASNGRIAELDGLRAIAIVSVLVWHYAAIPFPGLPKPVWATLALGRSGVDLFFVLSGFLISGILLENRSASNFFRVFYIRRILRIWPSYFALVGVWLIAHCFALPETESDIPWWQYVLLLQNFGMSQHQNYGTPYLSVTWSLAVEEQFYLLFPAAVWCLSTKRLSIVLGGTLIVAPVLRIAAWHFQGNDWWAYTALPARADTLALGALVAIATRNGAIWDEVIRRRNLLLIAMALLAPGFGALAWLGPGSAGWTEFGYSFLGVFYALIHIIALAYRDHPKLAFLRSSVCLSIARISYTTYLVHTFVLHGIMNFWGADAHGVPLKLGAVLTSLFITLAYAEIFFRCVEGPAIKFGHVFRYARAKAPHSSMEAGS